MAAAVLPEHAAFVPAVGPELIRVHFTALKGAALVLPVLPKGLPFLAAMLPILAAAFPIATLAVVPPVRLAVAVVHIIAGAGIIEAVMPTIIRIVATVAAATISITTVTAAAVIIAAIIRIVIIVIIAAGADADGEAAIAIATVIGCAGAQAERGCECKGGGTDAGHDHKRLSRKSSLK